MLNMLRLNNFSAGYRPIKVVKNISLEIREEEVVTIVGPNGAGKTTILKGIVGLADIFDGTVNLDGADITAIGVEKAARLGIVLVPDERRLFLDMTCVLIWKRQEITIKSP
jgi:branched-chain amino acid transport system ATP-binding protein